MTMQYRPCAHADQMIRGMADFSAGSCSLDVNFHELPRSNVLHRMLRPANRLGKQTRCAGSQVFSAHGRNSSLRPWRPLFATGVQMGRESGGVSETRSVSLTAGLPLLTV